ncbi:MAG: asparagine synthase (glutamine-hydrolyzing) [Ilumatobacteraceae bacterium]
MCGFAGVVRLDDTAPPPSRELLARMIWAIRHRGPDGFGMYRDDRAGLVHARLAIVDLAGGAQPLSSADGEWWIVFNGEIFNHRELRAELHQLGHRFRTTSDTEVVVNAFVQWGTGCFNRFNGQWALALWNARSRRLVLSRDPTGICPLFLREHDATVSFGSEVKALLADPDARRALDPRGIDQTFTYWGAIAPNTPYAGIEELRPGSFRVYSPSGHEDGVHWSPEYPPSIPAWKGTLENATDELRRHLVRASELRVSSADVPVGAYLSGGLDSSVTALLGLGASRGEFSTFSIRFDDDEFDEGHFQQLMATRLGSAHHELRVGASDIAEVFPDVIWHTERPVLRTAAAPMFLLSRAVRAVGIKAVLTGEGADEVLAGYDLFREAKIRAFWARRPDSTVRPLLFDRIYPYLAHSTMRAKSMTHAFWKIGLEDAHRPGFSHQPRWRSAAALRRFFAPDFAAAIQAEPAADHLAALPAAFSSWGALAQAQYLEITTLLSPYILSSQGDRQLLANGVEGRFPFLDRGVIDFCNALPPSFKLRGLDEKHILKRMARGLVPDEILDRPKQPYRAPDAVCFVGSNAPDYVGELLAPAAVDAAGVFGAKGVTALSTKLRRIAAGEGGAMTNSDNMALVGILSVQLLHHRFIQRTSESPSADLHFGVDVDATSTASST